MQETNLRLTRQLEIPAAAPLTERLEAVERKFWPAFAAQADVVHRDFREYLAFRYLKKQIKDIVFGYGPLEDLLRVRERCVWGKLVGRDSLIDDSECVHVQVW